MSGSIVLLSLHGVHIRASREVVLAALYTNGDAILFADNELKYCPRLLPLEQKTLHDDEELLSLGVTQRQPTNPHSQY